MQEIQCCFTFQIIGFVILDLSDRIDNVSCQVIAYYLQNLKLVFQSVCV